jgi:membrane dipeptidase
MTRIAMAERPLLIDGLQYCNWSRAIFEQMQEAQLTAVHATIAYHENFRETVSRISEWNWRFRDHADLILHARSVADIERARASNRTAIVFGVQNSSPIEADLGLLQVLHTLGVRFMQMTYNNQSLLGSGWCEPHDVGVTRMGREVIEEMNALGMVIDLSHAGERTMLETIELSQRPVAVTHANPTFWRAGNRNVSDTVLAALARSHGIIGVSLYAHHLAAGPDTSLESFCEMVARLAERIGVERIGIGSDLCQDQPHSVLRWMREGRWMRSSQETASTGFPPQPHWFADSRGFSNLARGLRAAQFSATEVEGILGGNLFRFMQNGFEPRGGEL